MKYASLLLCLGTVLCTTSLRAATPTIQNGSFSAFGSPSFTGWTCPGTCSGEDADPTWMQVTAASSGSGLTDWLEIGDWNSSATGGTGSAYVDQSVSNFSKGTNYTLHFTYGEVYNYNYYTSTDFPTDQDGFFIYLGGTGANPTTPAIYSATNFFVSNPTQGQVGTYIEETTVSAVFTTPGSGGGTESEILELAGYDELQNIFVTGLSITAGGTPGAISQSTQEIFIADSIATPEPGTFGFMAIAGGALLAGVKKFRSARK